MTLLWKWEYDTPPANILLLMLLYITKIMCTKIYTSAISNFPTYFAYVTGAIINLQSVLWGDRSQLPAIAATM